VGPRVGPDAMKKRKISSLPREKKRRFLVAALPAAY
jgi:hypothetical protein